MAARPPLVSPTNSNSVYHTDGIPHRGDGCVSTPLNSSLPPIASQDPPRVRPTSSLPPAAYAECVTTSPPDLVRQMGRVVYTGAPAMPHGPAVCQTAASAPETDLATAFTDCSICRIAVCSRRSSSADQRACWEAHHRTDLHIRNVQIHATADRQLRSPYTQTVIHVGPRQAERSPRGVAAAVSSLSSGSAVGTARQPLIAQHDAPPSPPKDPTLQAAAHTERKRVMRRQLDAYLYKRETVLLRGCFGRWYNAMFAAVTSGKRKRSVAYPQPTAAATAGKAAPPSRGVEKSCSPLRRQAKDPVRRIADSDRSPQHHNRSRPRSRSHVHNPEWTLRTRSVGYATVRHSNSSSSSEKVDVEDMQVRWRATHHGGAHGITRGTFRHAEGSRTGARSRSRRSGQRRHRHTKGSHRRSDSPPKRIERGRGPRRGADAGPPPTSSQAARWISGDSGTSDEGSDGRHQRRDHHYRGDHRGCTDDERTAAAAASNREPRADGSSFGNRGLHPTQTNSSDSGGSTSSKLRYRAQSLQADGEIAKVVAQLMPEVQARVLLALRGDALAHPRTGSTDVNAAATPAVDIKRLTATGEYFPRTADALANLMTTSPTPTPRPQPQLGFAMGHGYPDVSDQTPLQRASDPFRGVTAQQYSPSSPFLRKAPLQQEEGEVFFDVEDPLEHLRSPCCKPTDTPRDSLPVVRLGWSASMAREDPVASAEEQQGFVPQESHTPPAAHTASSGQFSGTHGSAGSGACQGGPQGIQDVPQVPTRDDRSAVNPTPGSHSRKFDSTVRNGESRELAYEAEERPLPHQADPQPLDDREQQPQAKTTAIPGGADCGPESSGASGPQGAEHVPRTPVDTPPAAHGPKHASGWQSLAGAEPLSGGEQLPRNSSNTAKGEKMRYHDSPGDPAVSQRLSLTPGVRAGQAVDSDCGAVSGSRDDSRGKGRSPTAAFHGVPGGFYTYDSGRYYRVPDGQLPLRGEGGGPLFVVGDRSHRTKCGSGFLGPKRLNPYCTVCRRKYNLVLVDIDMRPLRWASPRTAGLEQFGDCRTHHGRVFGGPASAGLNAAVTYRTRGEGLPRQHRAMFVPARFRRPKSPLPPSPPPPLPPSPPLVDSPTAHTAAKVVPTLEGDAHMHRLHRQERRLRRRVKELLWKELPAHREGGRWADYFHTLSEGLLALEGTRRDLSASAWGTH